MKKFIVFLLFLVGLNLNSQVCTTLVRNDRIETYDWNGLWWTPAPSAGYFTNASTSPTVSAALYGLGGGTSANEFDWYYLPNVAGLNPSNSYFFKFRLGSYTFSNSTATTRGVDQSDFIEVQISIDGEVTYTSEIRITGFSNAFWNYNTSGVINKTANGVLTTYSPTAGGNRTTTGDGYSVITLNLPSGISQIAIDIYARANAAGEEWWFDDFELYEIAPCIPLSIELVSFNGINQNNENILTWVTATETDNHFFSIERSLNAIDWEVISIINGAGTSNAPIYYEYKDLFYNKNIINYYRLKQTDYNGDYKYSNIIQINSESIKKFVIKTISIDGKEVDKNYTGFVIDIYNDGTTKKVIRY